MSRFKIIFDGEGKKHLFEEVGPDFYPLEDPDEFTLFMTIQHIERAMTDYYAEEVRMSYLDDADRSMLHGMEKIETQLGRICGFLEVLALAVAEQSTRRERIATAFATALVAKLRTPDDEDFDTAIVCALQLAKTLTAQLDKEEHGLQTVT
jgi:hypothetical protein